MAAATESGTLIKDFLVANPALDSELGEVEVMTDRYTNAEWAKQIAATQKNVVVDKAKKYRAPAAGSKELAETIDHTVLKLDATKAQIDALCSEARTEGFKVSFSQCLFCQRKIMLAPIFASAKCSLVKGHLISSGPFCTSLMTRY
jgi:hypothetical protein